MGYVEESLSVGEKVRYRTGLHWIVLAWPLVIAAISAVAAVTVFVATLSVAAAPLSAAAAIFGSVCVLVSLVAAVAGVVRRSSTEMAVTNRRVLMKSGVVRRKTVELLLSKVESIAVNQGFLGRMADYGSIVVRGTGGTYEMFDRVAHPLEFRKQVQQQIDAYQHPPA